MASPSQKVSATREPVAVVTYYEVRCDALHAELREFRIARVDRLLIKSDSELSVSVCVCACVYRTHVTGEEELYCPPVSTILTQCVSFTVDPIFVLELHRP